MAEILQHFQVLPASRNWHKDNDSEQNADQDTGSSPVEQVVFVQ